MKTKIFAFLFLLILLIPSCMTFRKNDEATLKETNKYINGVTVGYFEHKGLSNRYFYYAHPNPALPLLVIIHGAPGSSSAFLNFFKSKLITDHYSVVLVDRLGYGYSNYGHYSTIQEQGENIIYLIATLAKKDQPVFIAGHSYGGTIAAYMASLQPSFLTATVLMAPALDPENEKYFWFGKVGIWKATRWMLSGAIKVSADEKYSHAEELKHIEPNWKNIHTPLLHIHGNKDMVVPFENMAYTKLQFPMEYLSLHVWNEMNHFFPFSNTDETIQILHNYFVKFNAKNN